MSNRSLMLMLIFSIALSACSRAFLIHPAGSIESEIRFEFGYLDGERKALRITALNVYSISSDGTDELVWALEGRRRVSEIRYGVPPNNLDQRFPAIQLQPQGVYAVQASDRPLHPIKPPGGAFQMFYIAADGSLAECESVPTCFEAARSTI